MCKEFGWTPDEYDQQDAITLDKFEVMLAAYYKKCEIEEKKAYMRAKWRP